MTALVTTALTASRCTREQKTPHAPFWMDAQRSTPPHPLLLVQTGAIFFAEMIVAAEFEGHRP
jgi:hypothetical protein